MMRSIKNKDNDGKFLNKDNDDKYKQKNADKIKKWEKIK